MKPGTWLQILAAVVLAIGGIGAFIYAGFLPLPPFSDLPVPLAWQLIGISQLAAALGVFLGQAWGRALGLGIVAFNLALLALRLLAEIPGSNPLDLLLSAVVPVALDLFVLWVLVRRWPRPT